MRTTRPPVQTADPAGPGAGTRAEALAQVAEAARRLQTEPRQALALAQAALAAAERLRAPTVAAKALRQLGAAFWQLGQFEQAAAAFARGLSAARRARDRVSEGRCLNGLGAAHDRLGHYSEALAHFQAFVALSAEQAADDPDAALTYLMGVVNVGHVLERTGRHAEALANYQAALPRVAGLGRPEVGMLHLNLGVIQELLGQHEPAAASLDLAVQHLQTGAHDADLTHALLNRAEVRRGLGRLDEAEDDLRRSRALAQAQGALASVWRGSIVAARVAVQRGDAGRAVTLLEQALDQGDPVQEPELRRLTHEALVLAHETLGQHQQALAHHKRYAELSLAAARQAADEQAARAVQALARPEPAPPRVRLPARRDGPRPAPGSTPAPAAQRADLSGRELEVLELIGQGCTNKLIGKALGISPNTVRFHVASIFDKLGTTRRSEAVRLLAAARAGRPGRG
jgi:DNA-binding CsgD family transcriptional regulator